MCVGLVGSSCFGVFFFEWLSQRCGVLMMYVISLECMRVWAWAQVFGI